MQIRCKFNAHFSKKNKSHQKIVQFLNLNHNIKKKNSLSERVTESCENLDKMQKT